MGWEAIHLYQFSLRAVRYGSSELTSSSPDITLAALRLRKGNRFLYEYRLNIPWRHGIRIEDRMGQQPKMTYPTCTGGSGACPPEDCHDPARFSEHRFDSVSWEALEDLDTMVEILGESESFRGLDRSTDLLTSKATTWKAFC
jgi:hypothetical protein